MRLGIFAKTFEGDAPATVLTSVKAAGFNCAHYNMACSGLAAMPDAISESSANRVRDASRQTGVSIIAVSGTYNMIHPDPSVRNLGLARLATLAAHCAAMGTNLITLCTGTRDAEDQWRHHPENNSKEAWRDLQNAMADALYIADKYNITLGIEPELANVVNSANKAKQLIEEMKSDRLKVIFDAANLIEQESPDEQRLIISSGLELLADHIIMAHAKDKLATGAFATAGKGFLDFAHYFACLKAIGFDGPLITHGLKPEEAADVALHLREVADQQLIILK
jgi:sugar phosphate isomerase/epimerase